MVPTNMLLAVTTALLLMVSVPWPDWPTVMAPVVVKLAPAPDTVMLPIPVGPDPIATLVALRVPPFWIVSMPVAVFPTTRTWAVAPAVPTTASGCAAGGELMVVTNVLLVGIWLGGMVDQLPAVNQSVDCVPCQSAIMAFCARVGDVAASNAAARAVVVNNSVRIAPPPVCDSPLRR